MRKGKFSRIPRPPSAQTNPKEVDYMAMKPDEKRSELLDSLVDIRDVRIDRTLPVEERMKSYVEQIKNPYMFKVGDTVVRVSYANTSETINDNFINLIASL